MIIKKLKQLIIGSVLVLNFNIYADLQDALLAYENQNYELAYQQFLQLAEVHNPEAIYNLGVMFYKGQHLEKNLQQAYAWMKLASEYDAFFKTAIVEKKLNAQQKNFADKLFKELNQQYGPAIFKHKYLPEFNTTEEYIYDKSKPKPLVKYAPIYPKRAAERGVAGIVIVAYRVNPDGSVSELDILTEYPEKFNFAKKAINSTKKFKYEPWDASVDGASKYHYMINMYNFKIKMSIQEKDKFDQLVSLSNENNAKAQFALANYITPIHNVVVNAEYSGVVNKRNKFVIPEMKSHGNELLLNSAINGDVNAQVYLGMRLLLGHDVETDKSKAINWLKQGAENGSEFAKKQLNILKE